MFKASRHILLQLLGLALVVIALIVIARHFPIVPMIVRLQHKIGAMEWWGAVLYPLLVAGCNVLLLPGGILAVGSGLFFGLWWGCLLVLVGHVIGAAISFGIGRKLGRGWLEKKLFKHRKWAALDEAIAKQGWKIIFFSQIHPLFPSSLLNYLYGVTRIRFWTCMLWIALGQLPGVFLYAYFGTLAQLGIKLLRHKTHPHFSEYVIWIGGLVLTLVVTSLLARIALKILAEVQRAANESPSPKADPLIAASANSEPKKDPAHF